MNIKNLIKNKNNYLTLFLLFTIAFIDQISLLLINPLLPSLVSDINHVPILKDSSLVAIIISVYAFMQFVFAPIIGSLSDKYGRRIVLIFCLLFFSIDYLIMALSHSIWLLFLGRLLSGIPGGSISTVFASISDFSNESNKVKNYGLIYSSIGLGLILGPMLGGYLASTFGLRFPFWFAAFFCLLNLIICFIYLPETLPKDRRKKYFHIKNPIISIINIGKYSGIKEMQIAQFLNMIAFQAPIFLWVFYCTNRFNLDLYHITFSLSYFGMVYVLVQVLLVKLVNKILGDKKVIIIGTLLYVIASIIFAFTNNVFVFYIALFIFALGSIGSSSVMNIFSSSIPKNEQGELQGVIASINSLCAIIGPLIMNYLYKVGLRNSSFFVINDGLPFIFAAILFVLCIVFCNIAFKKIK